MKPAAELKLSELEANALIVALNETLYRDAHHAIPFEPKMRRALVRIRSSLQRQLGVVPIAPVATEAAEAEAKDGVL